MSSAVIICLAVSEVTIGDVISFSEQRSCGVCGCRVWVSRSALDVINADYLCMECFRKAPLDEKPIRRLPGSAEELIRSLGEVAGRKFVADLDSVGVTEVNPNDD